MKPPVLKNSTPNTPHVQTENNTNSGKNVMFTRSFNLKKLNSGSHKGSFSQTDNPYENDPSVKTVAKTKSQTTQAVSKGIEIKARVTNEIFHSAESGYTVLAVKISGQRGDFVLQVTTNQRVNVGDPIRAHGDWGTYKGKTQFKADMIQLEIPRESRGIFEWLCRGGVQGVSNRTAQKLLDHFGERLPDVIGDENKLAQAKIPEIKTKAIAKAWNNNNNQPELVALLSGVDLKPKQIAKVIEHFGASARKVIEENPWELMEIDGIGFKTADQIARINKIDLQCAPRIQAGLVWVLTEAINQNGHCAMPRKELVSLAARKLLVPEHAILNQMDTFVDNIRVIEDEQADLIYPKSLFDMENELASHLIALLKNSSGARTRQEAEQAVLKAERQLGVELDREGNQFEAAIMALSNAVVIITGGPGTGKSTTQRVIALAKTFFNKKIELVAPTGRAAKRLAETSGRDAKTIHRMLKFNSFTGGFVHTAENQLKVDDFLVDEYSMVDLRLAASLLSATQADASLAMIGDVNQLPSVGPGQILKDMIDSKVIPVVELTKIHRTAEGSGIAVAAKRIKSGQTPVDIQTNMRGFEISDSYDGEVLSELIKLIKFELTERGFDPMKDIQVLAAQKKGDLGVHALNSAIKQALNPALDDENTVTIKDVHYTIGDRIMQMKNDYARGVYNGELGIITDVGIGPDDAGARTPFIMVDYLGVEAKYNAQDIDNIEHAFAATVHKSQGCEFPVIILVTPYDHRFMLNSKLIYTGVTRAKTECIMLGSQEIIDKSIDKADSSIRYTGLKNLLIKYENAFTPSKPMDWPS